eukprot:1515732-Karenia_brevis.AAC.1
MFVDDMHMSAHMCVQLNALFCIHQRGHLYSNLMIAKLLVPVLLLDLYAVKVVSATVIVCIVSAWCVLMMCTCLHMRVQLNALFCVHQHGDLHQNLMIAKLLVPCLLLDWYTVEVISATVLVCIVTACCMRPDPPETNHRMTQTHWTTDNSELYKWQLLEDGRGAGVLSGPG